MSLTMSTISQPSFDALKSQKVNDSMTKPSHCMICGEEYAVPSAVIAHMKTHSLMTTFNCFFCGQVFLHVELLYRHLCYRHCRRVPHEKNHYKPDILRFFMRKVGNQKPYKCLFCRNQFGQRERLETHIRIHLGERSYKCSLCEQDFTRIESLQCHFKTHFGQAFNCSICTNVYSDLFDLQLHFLCHSGTRNNAYHEVFKCPESSCTRVYLREDSLQKHMKKHAKERSHKCKFCHGDFYSESFLIQHEKIHKGENCVNKVIVIDD